MLIEAGPEALAEAFEELQVKRPHQALIRNALARVAGKAPDLGAGAWAGD